MTAAAPVAGMPGRFPRVPAERRRHTCPVTARPRTAPRASRGLTRAARSGRHTIRRLSSALAAVLLPVLCLAPSLMVAPPAAAIDLACYATGHTSLTGPDSPGTYEVLPRVALWRPNDSSPAAYVTDNYDPAQPNHTVADYTLYELNGTSGLDWSVNGYTDKGKSNCSLFNTGLSYIAQGIFTYPRELVAVVNSMQELSLYSTPTTPLVNRLDGTDGKGEGQVSKVFRNLTIPGIPIMLALTGLWILYLSRPQRGGSRETNVRKMVDGAIGAAVATVVLLFLLVGNEWRPWMNAGDRAVGVVNSAVDSALLPDVGSSGPCSLPTNAPNRGERLAVCDFYNTFAFKPWAKGQFGPAGGQPIVVTGIGHNVVSGKPEKVTKPQEQYKAYLGNNKVDLRIFQVEAQSFNFNDEAAIHAGKTVYKGTESPNSQTQSPWGQVLDKEEGPPSGPALPSYDEWAGQDGFNRIGIALSDSLWVTMCALVPLLACLFAFMFHLLAWLAIFALPLVGLLGVFPPFRMALWGLLNGLVRSFGLRVAFGGVVLATEILYSTVFATDLPIGLQLLVLVIVVLLTLKVLKLLLHTGQSAFESIVHESGAGAAALGRQHGRRGLQYGRRGMAAAGGSAVAGIAAPRRAWAGQTRSNDPQDSTVGTRSGDTPTATPIATSSRQRLNAAPPALESPAATDRPPAAGGQQEASNEPIPRPSRARHQAPESAGAGGSGSPIPRPAHSRPPVDDVDEQPTDRAAASSASRAPTRAQVDRGGPVDYPAAVGRRDSESPAAPRPASPRPAVPRRQPVSEPVARPARYSHRPSSSPAPDESEARPVPVSVPAGTPPPPRKQGHLPDYVDPDL